MQTFSTQVIAPRSLVWVDTFPKCFQSPVSHSMTPILQYVEWCYTEDDGKIWVPYPRRIAYMLEDSYKQSEYRVRGHQPFSSVHCLFANFFCESYITFD